MDEEEKENPQYETKKLVLYLKENEAKFISGELSLDEPLDKTDRLYEKATREIKKRTANNLIQDSGLMQLQSKIVRQRAKSYKPDTLIFDARIFSEKLKTYYLGATNRDDTRIKSSSHVNSIVWQKLGEESLKNMHTTPTLSFIFGTFNAEPASPVKKKRKRIEKEKIAEAVQPQIVVQSDEGKDEMLGLATKIYSIFVRLMQKKQNPSVCFYEFVTDPSSFTRTIENIFGVSLLVQNGYLCIFPDEQGMPYLRLTEENEKKERLMDPNGRMQSVVSMSVAEWKAIITKFNFKKAIIPPKRTQPNAN